MVARPGSRESLGHAYERFREPLLEKARRWFPALRGIESDLYQSAWEALLRNLEEIEDIEKYLERAVFTKGLDELRRRERRPAVSLETVPSRAPGSRRASPGPTGPEAVADGEAPSPEEQAQLREEAKLALELLDDLSVLQQRIVKLRWGWRVPRKEAARLLGISERRLRREIEEAGAVIAENARLVQDGLWCERKRSLLLAYSFELLSTGRAAKAEQHLKVCPACRQAALGLRRRIAGVAAVTPFPLSAVQPAPAGLAARMRDLLESAHVTLSDLAAAAKHHVLALLFRPPAAEAAATQVAGGGGLRGGGGTLAAIAACLVAGGGAATYCSLEGVPQPLRNLAQPERQQKANEKRIRVRSADLDQPGPAAPLAEAPSAGTGDQPSENASPPQTPAETQPLERAPSPAPKDGGEFGVGSVPASPARSASTPSPGGEEFTP